MRQRDHPAKASTPKGVVKSASEMSSRIERGGEWDELQRALLNSSAVQPEALLRMQPLIGNQAVLQLVHTSQSDQKQAIRKPEPRHLPEIRCKSLGNILQRWNPKGHRAITAKALENETIKNRYTAPTRAILEDRSPDMDYIQDQQDKMNAGIAKSNENIEFYKKTVKQLAAKPNAGLKQRVDEMWRENELHQRKPDYMRLHGEGGLYQKGPDAAAEVNKAVTTALVNKAVSLYNGGNAEVGIEILGDAIHQAEDRGAHGEGAAGSGHDARQTIKKEERDPDHWGAFGSVPAINDTYPYPDNSDINVEGADRSVQIAHDVLLQFSAKVVKLPISARATLKRHAVIAGIETTSKGWGTWVGEEVAPRIPFGKAKWSSPWSGGHIKNLPGVGGGTTPQDTPGNEDTASTLGFYLEGLQQQKARDFAREKFMQWKKPQWRGGLAKEERIRKCKHYFHIRVDPLREVARPVASAIRKAYQDEFGNELDAKPVLRKTSAVDDGEYNKAKQVFSVWHRWRVQKFFGKPGGLSASERIRRSQSYYLQRVIPWLSRSRAVSTGIKAAYKVVFDESGSALE